MSKFLGVLIGSSGLEIGQLRFYPKALEESEIEEIYQDGSRLADMSTGSEPANAAESELLAVQRSITGDILQVQASMRSRQDSVQSDITAQAVNIQNAKSATLYSSPAMSVGDTNSTSWDGANGTHTPTADTVLFGRKFYQVVHGAHRLTATSDAEARYITNAPDFVGSGATITFWYRHVQCSVKTCGAYFLHAGDFKAFGGKTDWCWTAWFENEAFWNDVSPNSGYEYFDDHGVVDKFKLEGQIVWRHMSLQFDEITDMFRLYMDGTLVFEDPWGGPVSAVDCVGKGKKWSLGHAHPGYNLGAEVEFADLRLYHHGTRASGAPGPLTANQILKLARASTTGLLNEDHKCLVITDPKLSDTMWQDSFGHGCDWFFTQSKLFPELCLLDKAAHQCPISCKSKQECYTRSVRPTRYFTWDRTRLINLVSQNGTICLGSNLERETVIEQCKAWVDGGAGSLGGKGVSAADNKFLEGWLDSMAETDAVPQPRKGKRVNITNCETLGAAIDSHCGFNIEQVKSFTHDLKENGGDFTIAFW